MYLQILILIFYKLVIGCYVLIIKSLRYINFLPISKPILVAILWIKIHFLLMQF